MIILYRMNKQVIIVVGLPGSGKTTFSHKFNGWT